MTQSVVRYWFQRICVEPMAEVSFQGIDFPPMDREETTPTGQLRRNRGQTRISRDLLQAWIWARRHITRGYGFGRVVALLRERRYVRLDFHSSFGGIGYRRSPEPGQQFLVAPAPSYFDCTNAAAAFISSGVMSLMMPCMIGASRRRD